VSQPTGFFQGTEGSRWPRLPSRTVVIGGTPVTCSQAAGALSALSAAGGIMVAQALRAAGNPLAACDYHAAAAPFREEMPGTGRRGAAGRPVTKTAFMRAVSAALERAAAREPALHFAPDLAAAREAFSGDSGYAAAMASAAVRLLSDGHRRQLRASVAAASRAAAAECASRAGEFSCAAVSACGTGDCRLAPPHLAGAAVPASPGRVPRPANHARAGEGFGLAAAVIAAQAAAPFAVHVRVSSGDSAKAAERVAAA
jgi:hypothetical protein